MQDIEDNASSTIFWPGVYRRLALIQLQLKC